MLKKIGNNIASRLSPTRAHWSGLKADFSSRLRAFRKDRASSFQQRMEKDFDFVMEVWGIEAFGHIPFVIREMKMRCAVFALPVLALFLLGIIWPSFPVVPVLVMCVPPCLFGIVTSLWRIAVLQNRAFIPFHRWLLNPFFWNSSLPKE